MNKYEVLCVVGEGAYGVVLQCRNKESGEIVAIKKFKESDDDEAFKKTTVREVKILRMLRHNNIVSLTEAFRRRTKLYLVFEYVEKNLLEVLESQPQGLDPEIVRVYVFQLCLAINWCHSHSVIHRDIKPENLLINVRSKILKLCDFGFARVITQSTQELTDYVATRWYRAPELLLGSTNYGFGVDMWAIGCIMGEISDGQPIFPGESEVDQLYKVQRVLGPLTPEQMELFMHNPRFVGLKFPEMRAPETLQKKYVGKLAKRALAFIRACLVMEPKERLTSDQALSNNYFDEIRASGMFVGAAPTSGGVTLPAANGASQPTPNMNTRNRDAKQEDASSDAKNYPGGVDMKADGKETHNPDEAKDTGHKSEAPPDAMPPSRQKNRKTRDLKERQREIEKEAERERERQREKEIREFRDFSSKLGGNLNKSSVSPISNIGPVHQMVMHGGVYSPALPNQAMAQHMSSNAHYNQVGVPVVGLPSNSHLRGGNGNRLPGYDGNMGQYVGNASGNNNMAHYGNGMVGMHDANSVNGGFGMMNLGSGVNNGISLTPLSMNSNLNSNLQPMMSNGGLYVNEGDPINAQRKTPRSMAVPPLEHQQHHSSRQRGRPQPQQHVVPSNNPAYLGQNVSMLPGEDGVESYNKFINQQNRMGIAGNNFYNNGGEHVMDNQNMGHMYGGNLNMQHGEHLSHGTMGMALPQIFNSNNSGDVGMSQGMTNNGLRADPKLSRNVGADRGMKDEKVNSGNMMYYGNAVGMGMNVGGMPVYVDGQVQGNMNNGNSESQKSSGNNTSVGQSNSSNYRAGGGAAQKKSNKYGR